MFLSTNTISAEEFAPASAVDSVFRDLGVYYDSNAGNYGEGMLRLGYVDLNLAILEANKNLNDRPIHPGYVSNWFQLFTRIPCKHLPSLELCFDIVPKRTVGVTLQLIEGLTMISPAFDFSKGDSLVQLVGGVYPQRQEWEQYIDSIIQKLISKGQSPSQCGFMINLVRSNFLNLLDKYHGVGISVDQFSCNKLNTPFGFALTGNFLEESGSRSVMAANPEAAIFLYRNGADLTADQGAALKRYLSNDKLPLILKDLHSIRALDLDLLGSLAYLTWNKYPRTIGHLEELISLGVVPNKHSLLWKLAETKDFPDDDGIVFSKVLLNAGADINEIKGGRSLVQYLVDLKKTKWVIWLCNNGAKDSLCNIE
jgi:hypothetical protein